MLDADTPIGRAWIGRQLEIADECARDWRVTVTRTVEPCAIDALFARDDRLVGIAEIKARALTYADLDAHTSYLVTFDKLVAGRDLAMRLNVPYSLIVGLVDRTLWWPICNERGDWLAPMRTERTRTQATSNGGSAVRMNAYLELGAGRPLRSR